MHRFSYHMLRVMAGYAFANLPLKLREDGLRLGLQSAALYLQAMGSNQGRNDGD